MPNFQYGLHTAEIIKRMDKGGLSAWGTMRQNLLCRREFIPLVMQNLRHLTVDGGYYLLGASVGVAVKVRVPRAA